MRRSRDLVGASLLLLLPSLGVATAADPRGERARAFLVDRLTAALKLSDGEAAEVRRIIGDSEEHRRRLRRERAEVEDRLRLALGERKDDGELEGLVAEANRIDEELALLPERNYRELQKALTVEQRARLVLFRPEMQRDVRRAIRRPPPSTR